MVNPKNRMNAPVDFVAAIDVIPYVMGVLVRS